MTNEIVLPKPYTVVAKLKGKKDKDSIGLKCIDARHVDPPIDHDWLVENYYTMLDPFYDIIHEGDFVDVCTDWFLIRLFIFYIDTDEKKVSFDPYYQYELGEGAIGGYGKLLIPKRR